MCSAILGPAPLLNVHIFFNPCFNCKKKNIHQIKCFAKIFSKIILFSSQVNISLSVLIQFIYFDAMKR